MAKDDWVAAPPDDGGHQGSFTVPYDEVQCPDGEERHPPSDQDPSRPGGTGASGSMLGWAIAFAIITLIFIGAYGFAC
jgi:hypothetical protein